MEPGVRTRVLTKLLKGWGVKEPEAEHIFLLQRLVDTEKPSASASFPNGIVIAREYRSLVKREAVLPLNAYVLNVPGVTEIPELGLNVVCTPYKDQTEGFCVRTAGSLILRQRQPGDEMRLPGGTKELKKLFIDRKIPASQRCRVPVLADDCGVVGVLGIGPNRDRIENPTVCIRWEENKT
jgi:tRNA(Ile)-lysidine synthase